MKVGQRLGGLGGLFLECAEGSFQSLCIHSIMHSEHDSSAYRAPRVA